MTRCGCPSSADQHPPQCPRCGHCGPHWLNGACPRIGCSKCAQVLETVADLGDNGGSYKWARAGANQPGPWTDLLGGRSR